MSFLVNLIKKIILKLQSIFFKINYNEKKYSIAQDKLFSELKLSRKEGLKKLSSIKSVNETLNSPMNSEHNVLLASLSLLNQPFKEILEIGTFDGKMHYFCQKYFLIRLLLQLI